MSRSSSILCLTLLLTAALAGGSRAEQDKRPVVNQFISCGDNWFLGRSMAIDSEASIGDAFDYFKQVFNTRRVYWRGLQAAVGTTVRVTRADNFMYRDAFDYFDALITGGIEKKAVEIAHAKGLEIWGVTQLGDYGVTADTPNFNDYPGFWEARLRQEHPEWIPTDKYGYRKQGGVIELAYPEARKALIDLIATAVRKAGYDGIAFMSYAENFSMRFQDEFGYNEPIVREFKRRHGIDIRTEPFNKYATREDWYRLRGEFVTTFLRELREALGGKVKIGVFLNPINPRKPMVWATLPQEYYTLGMIHMDVDTWVRDNVVDELVVYGGASIEAQNRTLQEMLFLGRNTPVDMAFLTSSPYALERWQPYYDRGVNAIAALGREVLSLERSRIPGQTEKALQNGTLYEKMKFLAQVAEGKSSCNPSLVLPLLKEKNVIVRRLALQALGALKDPSTIPAIEKALSDPEQGVRAMALWTLSQNQRPESFDAIVQCLKESGNLPLLEVSRHTLPRFKPVPYDRLHGALHDENPLIRQMAMYALSIVPRPEDLPQIAAALHDSDRYVAFLAAKSLGMPQLAASEKAHQLILKQLHHPDAAIQNRVAVSAGELVARGYDGPLRAPMLEALKKNFLELGSGTQRTDREWGHRSIGNALLAYGPQGESVLRELKNNAEDLRIRELAWQVLYFREKPKPFINAFNIITEEENEEAYRQRPFALKNLKVNHLAQNFDDLQRFAAGDGMPATVGDVRKSGGRWGGFGPDGAYIDDAVARSGKQSLKLKRGGKQVLGWTAEGPAPGWDFVAEMWVRRSPQGSFACRVRDNAGGDFMGVLVSADGTLSLANPEEASAWKKTGLSIPQETWVLMKLAAEVTADRLLVSLEDEHGQPLGTAKGGLRPLGTSPTRIAFSPGSPDGNEVHLDDVRLYEIR